MAYSRRQVLGLGVLSALLGASWVEEAVGSRREPPWSHRPGANGSAVGLFGQSNAAIAGTDRGLADAVYPHAVFKVAVNGSSLAPRADGNDWSESGEAWRLLLDGAAELRGQVGDVVWVQGEADALEARSAEAYEPRLSELLRERLPEALGRSRIRYAIARLPDIYPYSDRIREAQAAVAEAIPHVSLVNTADITRGRDPWNERPGQPANLIGADLYPVPFPNPASAEEEKANFWLAGIWNIHYNEMGRYRLGQRCGLALARAH